MASNERHVSFNLIDEQYFPQCDENSEAEEIFMSERSSLLNYNSNNDDGGGGIHATTYPSPMRARSLWRSLCSNPLSSASRLVLTTILVQFVTLNVSLILTILHSKNPSSFFATNVFLNSHNSHQFLMVLLSITTLLYFALGGYYVIKKCTYQMEASLQPWFRFCLFTLSLCLSLLIGDKVVLSQAFNDPLDILAPFDEHLNQNFSLIWLIFVGNLGLLIFEMSYLSWLYILYRCGSSSMAADVIPIPLVPQTSQHGYLRPSQDKYDNYHSISTSSNFPRFMSAFSSSPEGQSGRLASGEEEIVDDDVDITQNLQTDQHQSVTTTFTQPSSYNDEKHMNYYTSHPVNVNRIHSEYWYNKRNQQNTHYPLTQTKPPIPHHHHHHHHTSIHHGTYSTTSNGSVELTDFDSYQTNQLTHGHGPLSRAQEEALEEEEDFLNLTNNSEMAGIKSSKEIFWIALFPCIGSMVCFTIMFEILLCLFLNLSEIIICTSRPSQQSHNLMKIPVPASFDHDLHIWTTLTRDVDQRLIIPFCLSLGGLFPLLFTYLGKHDSKAWVAGVLGAMIAVGGLLPLTFISVRTVLACLQNIEIQT